MGQGNGDLDAHLDRAGCAAAVSGRVGIAPVHAPVGVGVVVGSVWVGWA